MQAACSDSDTDSMFAQASEHAWIGGVVAWLDLRSPERARKRLASSATDPKLRGFRHLIHDEPDPHWILGSDVLESLALARGAGCCSSFRASFRATSTMSPSLRLASRA